MTMRFSYHSKPLAVPFLLLLGLTILISVTIAYCLVKSLYGNSLEGYTYKALPTSGRLLEYRNGLEEYYSSTEDDPDKVENIVAKEFDDYLLRILVKAADLNTATNDLRSESLSRANGLLAVLLVVVAASSLLYVLDSRFRPSITYKVHVENVSSLRAGIEHQEEQGGSHGTKTEPSSAVSEADPASTAGREGPAVAEEAIEPPGSTD
jgi:hypothetical protein